MEPRSQSSMRSAMLVLSLSLTVLAGVGGYLFWMQPAVMVADEALPAAGGETGTGGSGGSEPLLQGWERPAVALILSGEMHGYIEPCGCTAGQIGGLARRATLVRMLRQQRGWPTIGLDLGGTMIADRVGRRQTRIKFDFARDALNFCGFGSLGIGYEEALPRQDDLLEISIRDQGQTDFDLRLLSANVRPYPDNPELEICQPYRLYTVPAVNPGGRPVRVAVTSILGATVSQGIASDLFFKILPPADALQQVLPQMQAQRPDLLVLLSHAKTEESEALARQFPAFQVVVSLGGPEDGLLKPRHVGSTWFLQVGQKGKHVAVVGFYPQQPQPFRYELVKLDGGRFPNAPELDDMMQAYQDRLRDERPDLADNADPPLHPSGRTYVGAAVCKDCHEGSYNKWKTTGHAHAFKSLTTGRHDHVGRWIDRKWDAECIACHAVGWEPQRAFRWRTGFVDEATTPHLVGNQCENCHGPGSRHVELENGGEGTEEQRLAAVEEMRVSLETAKTKLCRQCHDGDNDPHFDFDAYWPKIEHHD